MLIIGLGFKDLLIIRLKMYNVSEYNPNLYIS
jgi:hypothetical protein